MNEQAYERFWKWISGDSVRILSLPSNRANEVILSAVPDLPGSR
jgi:hypothetical protein